ncbi:MAG: phasin family protein, partial [Pseudomonadota bacterium]
MASKASKTDDFSKYITDMLSAYKMDGEAFKTAFQTSAALNDKMAKVALDAAEKTNELSSKWAKDTLAKMGDVTSSKSEPQDYSKAMSDFATAQAELSAEMMSAYAEIAKKVQMETVELL